jgi:hypothetical protein
VLNREQEMLSGGKRGVEKDGEKARKEDQRPGGRRTEIVVFTLIT